MDVKEIVADIRATYAPLRRMAIWLISGAVALMGIAAITDYKSLSIIAVLLMLGAYLLFRRAENGVMADRDWLCHLPKEEVSELVHMAAGIPEAELLVKRWRKQHFLLREMNRQALLRIISDAGDKPRSLAACPRIQLTLQEQKRSDFDNAA